jgi:hypothetical protein
MATHYHIEDLRNGLRIKVWKETKLWERFLLTCVAAIAVLAVTHTLIGYWSWILSLVAASATFAGARGQEAILDATNVEFVARGNFGLRGSKTTRIVCTGDVRRLEFRDIAGQHRGLYAVTDRSAKCIVPFLDYSETIEIIQAIKAKFPGVAQAWHA